MFDDEIRRHSEELDRLSGRLRLLKQACITVGAALVPVDDEAEE